MPSLVTSLDLVVGNRYRVVRKLGSGGMGVVFEVIDAVTNRRMALKAMRVDAVIDDELRERFAAEARVTGRVASEHVVAVVDAGVDRTGCPYFVMELLEGQTLGARLKELGRLSITEALELSKQIGLGLDRIHEEQIVHRDLKPENVFITQRADGTSLVKIMDFGVAKVLEATTLATTRVVGTPLFMAPEQLRGDAEIDTRADLWSFAHLTYAMMVGSAYFGKESPHAGSVYPLIHKVLSGQRVPATQRAREAGVKLPRGFDRWFERATAMKPEERFACARDQVAALERCLDEGEHVSVGPLLRKRLIGATLTLAIPAGLWGGASLHQQLAVGGVTPFEPLPSRPSLSSMSPERQPSETPAPRDIDSPAPAGLAQDPQRLLRPIEISPRSHARSDVTTQGNAAGSRAQSAPPDPLDEY